MIDRSQPKSESPQDLGRQAEACEARFLEAGNACDLDKAIQLWEELLPQAEGDESSAKLLCTALNHLANSLSRRFGIRAELTDLDRALKLWREAAELTVATGDDPTGLFGNLGVGYGQRYERTGEIEDLRRSIAAFESALRRAPPHSPALPLVFNNLGLARRILYERLGDPADLEESCRLHTAAVEKTPAGSPARPGNLSSLGLALVARYQRTGSQVDLDRAVESLEESVGATPAAAPPGAMRRSNLGLALGLRYDLLGNLGDLASAVASFDEAVQFTPPGSPARPRFLNNLGRATNRLSERTGDPEQLARAIRSFSMAVEETPAESPELPLFLNNAGLGLSRQHERTGSAEDLEAAIRFFEDAVRQCLPESPRLPMFLGNLASALDRRYAATKDAADLRQAIDFQRDVLRRVPDSSPDLPRHLHDLAASLQMRFEFDRRSGDLAEAVELFRRAAVTGLEGTAEIALGSSRSWGDWATQRAEWKEAAEAYGLARQAIAKLFQVQAVRPHRESWLRDAQALPSREAFARLRSGDLTGAVLALEEGSARLLAYALDRNGSALRALEPVRPDLVAAFREAAGRLSLLERRGSLEEVGPIVSGLVEHLQTAQTELESVAAEIRRVPGFEGFLAAPKLADVRRALDPSIPGAPQVLVYLATCLAGSLALLVTCEEIPALDLDLTGEDLARLLNESDGKLQSGYLAALLSTDPDESRRLLEATLTELLPILARRVVRPTADRLRQLGTTRIALVPVGPLALLPLHAAGEPCLLDEMAVSYVPNARSLAAALLERSARGEPALRLAGVGDPSPHPRPLPGARTELQAVVSQFPAEETSPLYGEAATRAALLERLPRATHLHFACHGRFDPEKPLESGLELSGGEVLTLRDLLEGDVRPEAARLVVLSSCQSAVRDVRTLPDELISLPAGFLEAGVPGVVGTLWPVDDFATTLLMVRFYHLLRGDPQHGETPTDPAEALRRAQLWLRDLTAEELALHLRGSPEVPLLPQAVLAEGRIRYGLCEPGTSLFGPRDWAPFVFLGV